MAEVSPSVRAQVYERDGNQCVSCGSIDVDTRTVQHRLNRGAGSSAEVNDVEWLVQMCAGCNGALEIDARFAETGRRFGWKLRRGENPLRVAVFYVPTKVWRLLLPDGLSVQVSGRDPDDAELARLGVAA